MSTNIVMPQLGESVIEGTVGKWLKQVGESVKLYEPIIEVITDKVTTEIPSPASGTLEAILVGEGTTVHAGTVIGIIGESETQVESRESRVESQEPAAAIQESPVSNLQSPVSNLQSPTSRNRLTPVVARMIAEHDITTAELATIQGTGEGGRISKKDLDAFLKRRAAAAAPEKSQTQAPRQAEPVAAPARATVRAVADAAAEIVPLTVMRRAIAEHMTRSKQTIPHVTSIHEADMTRVIAHMRAQQTEFSNQGVKLTYTAYFAQAAIAAIQAIPLVNGRYTEQGIVMHRAVNLGIAVALEDGLIVPAIKNAEEKSLLALARAVNDLAARARAKKLAPEEAQGATFTITNYGIFGSLFGTPIIPFGTTAILGVGAIQKRVIVVDDAIAIRPMVYLGLTFDHRLLDAAAGDQFMQRFSDFLEAYA
ncbi:MAG: 2-oxo acid dehydrogenase subunit E2 [Anaerolineae bacterium]|nr:2-oxo acid dehydrogenase subunit E2 [Anaerolineae bacterium]